MKLPCAHRVLFVAALKLHHMTVLHHIFILRPKHATGCVCFHACEIETPEHTGFMSTLQYLEPKHLKLVLGFSCSWLDTNLVCDVLLEVVQRPATLILADLTRFRDEDDCREALDIEP